MIDSWRPRKLEPGFDAMYSMLRLLMTSTMKSPPGRSVVRTSTWPDGSTSRGVVGAEAGAGRCPWGGWAGEGACAPAIEPGTNAAAPVTAACFRKSRRPTDRFFDIIRLL